MSKCVSRLHCDGGCAVLHSLTRLAPRMIQISLIKSWSFAKKVKYDNYPDDGSCQSGRENKGSAVMGGGACRAASCNSHPVTIRLVILHCTHLETIGLNLSLRSLFLPSLRWWSGSWWGESDGWDTESSADIHHTISLHGGDHISERLARSEDLALWVMGSRYSCARVVLINRPNYSPGPGAGADCSISAWDKCHLSTNQKPDNGEPGPNKEM